MNELILTTKRKDGSEKVTTFKIKESEIVYKKTETSLEVDITIDCCEIEVDEGYTIEPRIYVEDLELPLHSLEELTGFEINDKDQDGMYSIYIHEHERLENNFIKFSDEKDGLYHLQWSSSIDNSVLKIDCFVKAIDFDEKYKR